MSPSYEKFILRSNIQVERVVRSTENYFEEGRFTKKESEIVWEASYNAPVYYRVSPGRTGRLLEYTNAAFSAEGSTYDAAIEALVDIASGQGWDVQ